MASQQSVPINAICIVFLLLVGTLCYSIIEGLPMIDALYLTCCVVTTVGLGDGPQTPLGKMFTVVLHFASFGLGSLLISEISDWRRERWRRVMRRSRIPVALLEVTTVLAVTLPVILFAALSFQWFEGWDFGNSLYFSIISASSLGLGNLEPSSPIARVFFVVYMFIVMGAVLHLLSALGDFFHDNFRGMVSDLTSGNGVRELGVEGKGGRRDLASLNDYDQ